VVIEVATNDSLWLAEARSDDPFVALAAIDRLIAWAEAQRARAVGLVRAAGRSMSEVLGTTNHLSSGDVGRLERRADTLGAAPSFGDALLHGALSAAHVDRLGETLRRLDDQARALLLRDEQRLRLAATNATANEFARMLRREEARLRRRDDGDRLLQQKAAVRLSSHTDRDTGMVVYRLAADPVSAVELDRLLSRRVETLFHRAVPDGCPGDPLERQAFLRAHALLSLVRGEVPGSSRSAGAEIIVVVDHTAGDGTPDIDWGRPVDIPQRVLDDLFGAPDTTVHEVVVRNGVVITAPGRLDLGRTTRLANRAQRRALRALYRGCAVPGCDATFDQCTIHHIHWWRHGGCTDLENLLPLCSRHHHLVHDRGWTVHLGPQRELTVTTPMGRTMSTGPPRRWAA
jgi:hypothetical protein